jgi:hypothetical protein
MNFQMRPRPADLAPPVAFVTTGDQHMVARHRDALADSVSLPETEPDLGKPGLRFSLIELGEGREM